MLGRSVIGLLLRTLLPLRRHRSIGLQVRIGSRLGSVIGRRRPDRHLIDHFLNPSGLCNQMFCQISRCLIPNCPFNVTVP